MDKRLTPAMVAALRLADEGPIRYYRGGWYTTEATGGSDAHAHRCDKIALERFATLPSLRVLLARQLIRDSRDDVPAHAHIVERDIYAARWTITQAGRDALAREDATK